MKNSVMLSNEIQHDFACVDAIITAHTNSAIAKANAEALQTYWEVGEYISSRITKSQWGEHIVSELANYLNKQNPNRRGYSKRNLYNMVKFYDTYSTDTFEKLQQQLNLSEFVQLQTAQIRPTQIVQLPTAQLQPVRMPLILCLTTFTNHMEILNRCNGFEEQMFYMLYAAEHHLKVEELRRCVINHTFEALMSKNKQMTTTLLSQYPGVEYMLKDRVLLDFLGLKDKFTEPQMHTSILQHMKQFVLEMGKDFLPIGDEFVVKVGNKDKRIDLLFYHRTLQCLVAVELKTVDFESEFVSKMDMYLEALDRDYKRPNENPSVGIILCPSADKAEVEYAMSRTMSPTMVAEYRRVLIPREVLTKSLKEYCEFLKKQYK